MPISKQNKTKTWGNLFIFGFGFGFDYVFGLKQKRLKGY